jgi:hypothetical protein
LPADPDWPDFDGVYCVGGDDEFGEKYDLRAMSTYRESLDVSPDYIMSDEEMQQFRRK